MVFEGVQQLGQGAAGADDAEARERRVPHDEHAPELEARPTLHVVLAAENEDHVDADVVKSILPVFDHPHARVLVHELLLEVEHVRVVGHRGHRQVQVRHRGAAGGARARECDGGRLLLWVGRLWGLGTCSTRTSAGVAARGHRLTDCDC